MLRFIFTVFDFKTRGVQHNRINWTAKKMRSIRCGALNLQRHFNPPTPPSSSPYNKLNGKVQICFVCMSLRVAHLAAARLLINCLAPKRNTSLVCTTSSCTRLSLHPCLDLTGHGQKCLLNISGGLGRSLKELDSKTIRKLLTLLRRDDTFGGQIGFVTDKEFVDILACISVNFVEPLLYIVEGFVIGNIVDDNDSMCATVVWRCDCAEAFLARGIPDLKFDCFSIELNGANFLHGECKMDGERS